MRMRPSWITAILALLVVSGCETLHSVVVGTAYQPYNSVIGGYSETSLGPDLVRVTFKGNSSTKMERAQDLALLRASDLARHAGFKYMVVLKQFDTPMLPDASNFGRMRNYGAIRG